MLVVDCLPASKIESVDLKVITLWITGISNRFNISPKKFINVQRRAKSIRSL
jgi:hypothetical protein